MPADSVVTIRPFRVDGLPILKGEFAKEMTVEAFDNVSIGFREVARQIHFVMDLTEKPSS